MTTTDAIPPAPFAPAIRTQADLEAAWRRLVRPLGFRTSSLWLMLVQADDTPVPQLIEITDCDEPSERAGADQLARMLHHLVAEQPDGSRWAILRSRPGGADVGPADRAWAEHLHAACAAVGVPLAPLHLATDHDIRPIPHDDLADLTR